MSEDTIKKALEIIKKIQDQGIGDNEKLEAVKNKIENSQSITLEEKQYISDNFQKIKGLEKNITKPLKLKKSHYVLLLTISVVLVGIFFSTCPADGQGRRSRRVCRRRHRRVPPALEQKPIEF